MKTIRRAYSFWGSCAAAMVLLGTAVATPGQSAAQKAVPTFSKDIMPIFQEKCQDCHRPGSIAPMSLLTYKDTRPYARSIRQKVATRTMPPWFLDKTVGIQHFKNDISLSDDQIATVLAWVDGGAPEGNPQDMPAAKTFADTESWHIGTPDLVVTSPPYVSVGNGPDWWGDLATDPHIKEDRWISAVETRVIGVSAKVVHHCGTSMIGPDGREESLSEFGVGKHGDIYPEDAGRLLQAGSKISFNMHVHADGTPTPVVIQVAYKFYPKGYVPKHKIEEVNVGVTDGHLFADLDIPPNSVTRHDAFAPLAHAARIISFQPHMHTRGKAMTLEAILPNGDTQVLSSVDHFNFNWQVAYVYTEDEEPLLPAGTILHTIGIHDNTAGNPNNPDPNTWVGTGNASYDDMLQCHELLYYLTDEEYQHELADRQNSSVGAEGESGH